MKKESGTHFFNLISHLISNLFSNLFNRNCEILVDSRGKCERFGEFWWRGFLAGSGQDATGVMSHSYGMQRTLTMMMNSFY